LNKNTKFEAHLSQKSEYEKMRQAHAASQREEKYLALEEARRNKVKIDWPEFKEQVPRHLGITVLENISLQELVPYIDWTPFFMTWRIRGSYPKIFEDKDAGSEAKKLFEDAQVMLKSIINKKSLQAKAVFGIFPANSVGDDIELYLIEERNQTQSCDKHGEHSISFKTENRNELTAKLHMLRSQRVMEESTSPNASLADFVAPKNSSKKDYVGAFCVTAGIGLDQICKDFEKNHDDYSSIMAKALADRLAEACAEFLHQKVRTHYWGYAFDERLTNDELIQEKYQGIRPAPGYSACPDHLEKKTLFQILEVEKNIGVTLTHSMAMTPASSVSGWYFSHPESRYFNVGKIGEDQLEDYANRKKLSKSEMSRWLSANLF
jgi:5-methyltetrahydrofolate--homocysteine methyltransferase